MAESHARCLGYANCCSCDVCRQRSQQFPKRLTEHGPTRRHAEALIAQGFDFVGRDEFDRPVFDRPDFGEVALHERED